MIHPHKLVASEYTYILDGMAAKNVQKTIHTSYV